MSGATGRRVADDGSALKLRVLSALALVPLALLLVVLGGWSFAALVALVVVLMAFEWARLSAARFGRWHGRLAGAVALLAGLFATALTVVGRPLEAVGCVALGIVLAGAIALVAGTRGAAGWASLGVGLVGLPAVALIWLRAIPEQGPSLLLWLLIVVWTTDTAAYFVGRRFGGPRLAPVISPGKTWSGLGGGIVGAAVASVVTAWVIGSERLVQAAGLGALFALLAQLGDLLESALKRRAGVKDSGALIPGHGGIFDRIDGLLLTAPALALLLLGPKAWPWP